MIIAQERSAPDENRHQAVVLLPPADPSDWQNSRGPVTAMWPVELVPRGPPSNWIRATRASIAVAAGHGWFERQVPSISRAAIPPKRRCGPSAHQIGPSPSQTWVGVQVKVLPAETTAAAVRIRNMALVLHPFLSPVINAGKSHLKLKDAVFGRCCMGRMPTAG